MEHFIHMRVEIVYGRRHYVGTACWRGPLLPDVGDMRPLLCGLGPSELKPGGGKRLGRDTNLINPSVFAHVASVATLRWQRS